MTTTKRRFHGTCSKELWEMEAPADGSAADWDGPISFDDGALFQAHMIGAHGLKPYETPTVKPYKAPRPGKNNYVQTDRKPGARVSWSQKIDGEEVTRSGQIWSNAPGGRCFWVAPDDRQEHEMVVCLRVEKDGKTQYKGFFSRTRWQKEGRNRAAEIAGGPMFTADISRGTDPFRHVAQFCQPMV